MRNYEKNLLKLFCVAAAFAFSACSIPFKDGEGTQKVDASAIPVPKNVTAQVKTTSRIDIAWQADAAAATYSVYRSTEEDGGYTGIATIKETSYIDNSVSANTAYFYFITLSANNRGESGKSATVRAATRAPDIPQGLKTTPASESSIELEWDAVDGVTGYKVYKSESDSDGEYTEKESVTETSWIDTGLIAETSYYYKVEAINGIGITMSAPVEGKIIPPPAPETPVISTSDGELTVSWQAVAGAAAYEVYIGISNDSADAEKNGSDINGSLSKTISGLTNGTTYYLWVKAKNILGTSGFSPLASGKPLGTPGMPTISANTSELIATWTTVAGADEYEVYCDTSSAPTTLFDTVNSTSVIITSLTNGTLYYVRIKAKNSTGISAYSTTASGTPSITLGLYDNALDMPHKIGNHNLATALTYLSSNAVTSHNYTIVLGANESASPCTLSYPGKTVGITLVGLDVERIISLNANGALFTVRAGVTLTLDDKITLVGRSANTTSLVSVSGTLVMNNGSKISGNTTGTAGGSGGGGVNVGSTGSFTMNGGTISGNTHSHSPSSSYGGGGVYVSGGTFTMSGGTISGNTSPPNDGGGVYVSSGTFTMVGGTISGNIASTSSSRPEGGGVYVRGGTFTMSGGAISGNTANGGGGVYVNSGTFTMTGGIISGNTASAAAAAYGGGVYVYSGTFTMSGGAISGNTASYSYSSNGGGVYVYSGTFKKIPGVDGSSSGVIYGSEAVGNDANGVPLKNNASYGSAVDTAPKRRNTTAGQTDYIDTSTGLGLSTNGVAPF